MSITDGDVHAAADRLDATGTKPTFANIRAALGSGSFSTIARALKTWTPASQSESSEPISADVAEIVSAMATRIWDAANVAASKRKDARLADLEAEHEQTVANLDTVVASSDELAASNASLQQEVANLTASNAKWRSTVAQRDRDLAAARAEVEALRQAVNQITAAIAAGASHVAPLATAE